MSDLTLDSSALLAAIGRELGALEVADLMRRRSCAMSTVNVTEVVTKLIDRGMSLPDIWADLRNTAIAIYPFDEADAEEAARLRTSTRAAGLSLGDRACIALAARLGTPVVTADQAWTAVSLPVEVILIR